MIKVLTQLMERPRHSIIPLLFVAALSISTTASAEEILFVSDSETDAINIPAVLSGDAPEEDLVPPVNNVKFRDGDEGAGFHNVTIIRNDYAVTGGAFGEAEGTNMALIGNLFPYCSVFWSASGPHEPLGLFPDRITNGNFEDISGTHPVLSGWTVGSPINWNFDFNTPPANGASSGAGFVDLTASGQISQVLTTEPGQTYMLSIDRKGDGSIVSLNGSYLLLTAGETSGGWTTYTAMFTAPTAMTSLMISGTPADLSSVDNVRFAPYPQTPGRGADGGLHLDADVLANLDYYVRNGGFVFVTGHDAITHPLSAPAASDGPLVKLLGGALASAGQEFDPTLSAVSAVPTAITLPPLAGTPSGGGENQVDTRREQDYFTGYDAATTPLVTGPGGAYWTVRSPYGDGVDDDGTLDGVDLTDGHIAYVANGVFFYQTDQIDSMTMMPVKETLSNGEDPSWLAAPYNEALLNFAANSCLSLPSAETPTAHDQSVSTFDGEWVEITLTGFDPNSDPLTFAIVTGPDPARGSLGALAGGTVRYTPILGIIGNDSFTFTVDDGTYTSPPATVSIEVLPVPPLEVDAGPDVSIDEGSGTPFASAGSFTDPSGCCWTAAVDYGNGGGSGTLALAGKDFNLANTYPTDDDALFLVTVTVTDTGDSDTDSDTAVVFINNVPPSVDAGMDGSINQGGTFASAGSFTDPGTLDTFSATVDYDDGGGSEALTILAGNAFALSHTYPTAGEYTVTVSVTDDDGGIGVDTATVTVVENTAPELDAIGDKSVDELITLMFTATASDAEIPPDVLTFSLDAGAPAGATINPLTGQFSWTPTEIQGPGMYSVTVRVTDNGVPNLADAETIRITVNEVNVTPVLGPIGNQSIDELTPLSFTATAVDVDIPLNMLTFSLDAGAPAGASINPSTGQFSWTPTEAQGPGSFPITVRVADNGLPNLSDAETITVEVNEVNQPPVVTVSLASQTVDYSDNITDVIITATDGDLPPAPLTMTPAGVLPAALMTSGGCVQNALTGTACSWTLSGIAGVPASSHVITFNVSDGDSTVSPTTTVVVEAEDATATLDEDNAVAVLVDEPGGDSGTFSLTVHVQETLPDNAEAGPAAAGDIDNAVVNISLVPVGPGGSVIPDSCDTPPATGSGYAGVLSVTCHFNGVPVNTYSVDATVNVVGYYAGFAEDVLTVYDPSLGFTTGGGWFYWPDTDDKTNFGYTMKYGKNGRNVKGSVLIMRHLADGTKYRFKSNALEGLAVGESTSPEFGWASFTGKGTYLEPGWSDPVGNHKFTTYVEDHGDPGTGADRIWFEVLDKDGMVLSGFSMVSPATANAETIDGGSIVVPHSNSGGKNKP
jgi:hypothetical protein